MRKHRTSALSRADTVAGSCRHVAGITLMESLIASMLIGIAAVGAATMFARGQAFIAGEGDNRVAVYLARQRIELARAQGFASLPEGTTTELSSQALATVTSNAFYTRTTVVDCIDANDYSSTVDCAAHPTAAKRVTVTVQSAPKEARQVMLRAVLANR